MSARWCIQQLRDEVDRFLDNVNDALETLRSIRQDVMKTHLSFHVAETVETVSLIAGGLFPPAAIVGGVTTVISGVIRADKNKYVFSVFFCSHERLTFKLTGLI